MQKRLWEIQAAIPTTEWRQADLEAISAIGTSHSHAGHSEASVYDLLHDYESWPRRPLPGVGGAALSDVMEGLIEIVSIEGPIVCERLYELYVDGSGDPGVGSVKRQLNRATYAAIESGLLGQIEPIGGGQIDKTVFLPDTAPVVIRERGPCACPAHPPDPRSTLSQRRSRTSMATIMIGRSSNC